MWFGGGNGSADATATTAVKMQMISELCSTLSFLENDYCSVENRCRDSGEEDSREEGTQPLRQNTS